MNFDGFVAQVNDYFLYAVDVNHGLNLAKRERRAQFWESIYHAWPRKHDEFAAFVGSDSKLLCITGRVGSGKTTYLRYHAEQVLGLNCVVFDMNSYWNEYTNSRSIDDVIHATARVGLLNNPVTEPISNVTRIDG